MKLKTPALVLILAVLFSTVGAYTVRFGSANFIPEEPPTGIEINSDGAVEGTTKLYRSGNVYTFTGDIYDTVIVWRDDIVLDGAGYTLQGNGESAGVFLEDRSHVTIKNLNIKNWKYGIRFTKRYEPPEKPISHSIIGNNITGNTRGILISGLSTVVIRENLIAYNTYGVELWSASNIFRDNKFRGNTYSFSENVRGGNDIDTSNIVNGKPVCYWVNKHDRTVPSNAGFAVLRNCSGITVKNLEIKGNGHGVLLFNTNNSIVTANVIIGNIEGVTLEESFNNIISDNYIADNDGHGIITYNSANNTISKNEITGNAHDGVNVENYLTNINYSLPNTVTENQITKNNGNGVFFKNIQDSEVTKNNITLNRGLGVGFGYGPNGTIQGNYVAKNGIGIWMSNAFSNKVTLNTVLNNEGWGIYLEGSQRNNIIHHNNFINNSSTEELQAYIKGTWIYPGLYEPQRLGEEREPPQLVDGAANAWDDGEEGNFWSDYMQRYPSASEVGNTGVGDTPYVINKNNLDSHPLIAPIEISTSSLPSPSQEPTSTSSPEPESEPNALPAEMTISAAVAVVAVSGGVLIYLEKRKR